MRASYPSIFTVFFHSNPWLTKFWYGAAGREVKRMAEDFSISSQQLLRDSVNAELMHIRQLGANESIAFAAANLGAYEALLVTILSGEKGIPVYQAVANVRTPFSGPAGIVNRLKLMRDLGILEERPGIKKSQVCLVASEKFQQQFHSVLSSRYSGGFLK